NLQGDVTDIYDSTGACVASYTYNAWGEHTVTNYTTANIGNINPFRYRGYYFDTETGFYYLNARYYDPQIKRFINADHINYLGAGSALKSYNLYAYCENNPVSFLDTEGTFLCAAIGALVGGLFGAVTALVEGKEGREVWASVADGAIAGATAGLASDIIIVTGGSAAVVIGVYAFAGAAGSYTGTLVEHAINGNDVWSTEVQIEAVINAAWGGIFGALGGVMTGRVSSIMDNAIKSAGTKRLAKGVTASYATVKALKKELRNIGSSFVEEFLSNFNPWFTQTSFEHLIGE
ncbi:MAG: RHS repeat-associated core domain-containing protein, partial [Clostridia bacterium]|nr:RHS repeat-associated core domain-containing protein [Clostridia bacterium]